MRPFIRPIRVIPSGRAARVFSMLTTLGLISGFLFVCTGFGTCDGTSHDGGTGDGATGKLQWYTTCGDPVCTAPDMGGWRPKTGIPLCTTEKAGDPCTTDGQQCDPKNDCNSLLQCATKDPKTNPGGCPISRRAYKEDIRYLDRDGLRRYADELQRLKLATYRYKSGGPTHLGFIIEDTEPSVSVDSPRDQVDLYGYTSMAVAAVKLQDERIVQLEQQVAELKRLLAAQDARKAGRK